MNLNPNIRQSFVAALAGCIAAHLPNLATPESLLAEYATKAIEDVEDFIKNRAAHLGDASNATGRPGDGTRPVSHLTAERPPGMPLAPSQRTATAANPVSALPGGGLAPQPPTPSTPVPPPDNLKPTGPASYGDKVPANVGGEYPTRPAVPGAAGSGTPSPDVPTPRDPQDPYPTAPTPGDYWFVGKRTTKDMEEYDFPQDNPAKVKVEVVDAGVLRVTEGAGLPIGNAADLTEFAGKWYPATRETEEEAAKVFDQTQPSGQ